MPSILAFITLLIAAVPLATAADDAHEKLIYLPHELEVELALAAGPQHVRSGATVYVFGKAGYERIRQGTNGMTCLVNRDGHQHGGRELRPTCWDAEGTATIVPIMLRVGELIARGAHASAIEQEIELGYTDGHFISPRKTGIAYMLRGDVTFDPKKQTIDRTVFPPHYMIYAPGVTNEDIGMTDAAFESNNSLPVIYSGYSGGSRTAYMIIVAADAEMAAH